MHRLLSIVDNITMVDSATSQIYEVDLAMTASDSQQERCHRRRQKQEVSIIQNKQQYIRNIKNIQPATDTCKPAKSLSLRYHKSLWRPAV